MSRGRQGGTGAMTTMDDTTAPRARSAWRRARRAVLALPWLLAMATGCVQAQSGCTPTPLPMGAQGNDLCYGTAAWREPTLGGRWLQQAFDFHRAPGTQPAPLIIWTHPNGSSKSIAPGSVAYTVLVAPALAAGFSFASVEFRHPVVNENEADSPTNPGVPHRDIARAIQFIRANAEALGIDRRNIFLVGGSRGTLALWTALQPDMADPFAADPVLRQSTRVNAVFAYNAQTTYDGIEFADLFLVPPDAEVQKAAWRLEHPKYAQFGSAVRSVGADAPPVMLRYDQAFIGRKVTLQELQATDEVHYPDYGLALCDAYRQVGQFPKCTAVGDPRFDGMPAGYAGYVDFFRLHLRTRPRPVLPPNAAAAAGTGKREGGARAAPAPAPAPRRGSRQ